MIKLFCKIKRIKSTFHFTQVDNIESILENGLIPIKFLKNDCIPVKINDKQRSDDCFDANCISVGYPNYMMFYTLRKKPTNINVNWCILELKSSILWEKKCKYCTTNAASGCQKGNRESEFNSSTRFTNMFKNISGKKNRLLLGLP